VDFFANLEALCSQTKLSDIFLQPGEQVAYVLNNRLQSAAFAFTETDANELIKLSGLPQWKVDEDRAVVIGPHRFRTNFLQERGRPKAVLRLLPKSIPSPQDLRIPAKVIETALTSSSGIIVFSGPTGSGKSTSLAALIQARANKRDEHVITLEDPIEYDFTARIPQQFTRREIGFDTPSFSVGLRSALRERPHVIMIGEIRDSETASIAIEAALKGHVIFATMHTGRVGLSLETLLSSVPADDYKKVLKILPRVLRTIVCQQLVPSIRGGVVGVHEVLMMPSSEAEASSKSAKFDAFDGILETGLSTGSRLFRHSLAEAFQQGFIDSATKNQYEATLQ